MSAQQKHAVKLGDVINSEELAQWLTGAGAWVELDSPDHGAAALAVWRMEDDDRSVACEEFARRLVASMNACAGVPAEVLEANASGGLPWCVADQIEARVYCATLAKLLAEARKIVRASSSRALTKDWDHRATAALAKVNGSTTS